MSAKYIFAALGTAFLLAGALRRGNRIQARAWLLVGAIFVAVSLLLFIVG